MKIIELTGSEITELQNALNPENTRSGTVYSVRVSVEGENVKFKVNGGMWSPPMGHLDPSSEYAQNLKGAANG